MNIVTSDDFIDMLNEGIEEDTTSDIDFNDEIVSIKSVGYKDTYDINVKGKDHFFYANNILTHNSATGASLDIHTVDNDSVSDSIGTVQTADFIMFLLQTPQMKEEGVMTCKVTKNRFNGRTDFWNMRVDYKHMRFSDEIIEADPNFSTAAAVGLSETQINTELANIKAQDIAVIKKHDSEIKDDFDIMGALGIE